MSKPSTVLRVRYPDLHAFEAQCYAANRPAVIMGAPQHHALRIFRFSPDYLEQAMGDMKFPVLSTDTGFLSYERDTVSMKFRDFVSQAFGGEPTTTQL